MRILKRGIVGVCLLATATVGAANDRFLGQFWGTGRACYGTLTITNASIAWLTTFNRCRAAPYKVLEQSDGRLTVRLGGNDQDCPFKVLSITHDTSEGADNGWDVSGYLSESTYRADRTSNFSRHTAAMSCYLIRDPDYVAPTD